MPRPDDPPVVVPSVDAPKPDPVLTLLAQILERLDQIAADQTGRLDTIRNIVATKPKERTYRTRRPNER